jgi:predicted Zn-dependent peptidase
LRGGVVAEPADRNGVAALTAGLLMRGAGERDAQAFAESIAAVGGEFESESNLEAIVLHGEFMARDSALMIGLLADALQRPSLSEDEFEKLRTRAIRKISAARDADLRSLIQPYAHSWVHDEHPYGRPVTGSEESLARVEHEDARNFYAQQIGADRLTLTLVGDFDSADLLEQLTSAFGDWRPAGAAAPVVPETAVAAGGRVLLVDRPGATQTYFGNTGVARADEATPAIDLVNTLFGGRFTSMLNNALRVESGLTYGARSLLERHMQRGSVGMFSFCATADTVAAIDLALLQLQRLHQDGFDAETLTSGRNYILGTWTLGLETGPQLADAVSELKFYDLPDGALNDYARSVAAVSAADTAAVIERVYPTRDELVYVIIGDGDAIRDQLSDYGEITELKISSPRFRP